MKSINKITLMLVLAVAVFASCKPDALQELGPERDLLASLQGNWKLVKATQVDEDAKTKGFPYQQLDITSLFPYTTFAFSLNTDANGPTTFTATPGTSPKIIKVTGGTWAVDNLKYPKNLIFTNGAVRDTVSLGGYPVGAATSLKLKKDKRDFTTGKLLISYTYEFNKQ
ncbi:MAG: DUF5004 domain-containing protein [Sphingobacteriales bacterium]|nr:MAG: DUF5004 domain-containing protein [Sphingobacteriales bacterium]